MTDPRAEETCEHTVEQARRPVRGRPTPSHEETAERRPDFGLTPRERDVVSGILAGRTNRAIARDLGITEQSVKNLLSIVYEKCAVRNRLELATLMMRRVLVNRSALTTAPHNS